MMYAFSPSGERIISFNPSEPRKRALLISSPNSRRRRPRTKSQICTRPSPRPTITDWLSDVRPTVMMLCVNDLRLYLTLPVSKSQTFVSVVKANFQSGENADRPAGRGVRLRDMKDCGLTSWSDRVILFTTLLLATSQTVTYPPLSPVITLLLSSEI